MANEFNIKRGFISNGDSTVNGKLTTQKLTITSGATSGYVLTSDASGNAIWTVASAGLTKFTEAENTSAPNGTVYVDSLTAAASSTNADAVISPKGSGAFLLRIPDNTGTGGNKRGIYAVDLSIAPSFGAYNVASGNYSAVLGGVHNASTADYSVSMGYYNAATGTGSNVGGGVQNQATSTHSSVAGGAYNNASGSNSSIAGGNSNSASGYAAFVPGGYGNAASNNYAFAVGFFNTSSGEHSGSFGSYNVSNATNSYAFGQYASTFGILNKTVYASGRFSSTGDAQKSNFILKASTTDATVTSLTTNGGGYTIGANNYVTLQDNQSIRFKGTIVGKKSGTTDTCAWDIDGLIVRGANAASTTLVVSNVTLVSNTPGWGVPTILADTSIGCLNIRVSGLASTNIRWVSNLETTEVIYA